MSGWIQPHGPVQPRDTSLDAGMVVPLAMGDVPEASRR